MDSTKTLAFGFFPPDFDEFVHVTLYLRQMRAVDFVDLVYAKIAGKGRFDRRPILLLIDDVARPAFLDVVHDGFNRLVIESRLSPQDFLEGYTHRIVFTRMLREIELGGAEAVAAFAYLGFGELIGVFTAFKLIFHHHPIEEALEFTQVFRVDMKLFIG